MWLINWLTLGLVDFVVVRQGEVRVIEKRGKFARVAHPGISMLVPLWGLGENVGRFRISQLVRDERGNAILRARDGVTVISTRMAADDYPKETVITRDNATISIDAVVYYRIFDAEKAVYMVNDYVDAVQKLVQSALRDECGKLELDELLVSRDKINHRLKASLEHATAWGINVDRVEIKDIDLGAFGQILAEQRAAETARRTEVTRAEGEKQGAILRSEGQRESKVLAARGDAESMLLRSEAEKQARVMAAEGEAIAISKLREAEAGGLLRIREAEARSYQIMKQVFDGKSANDPLLQVMAWQKAGEVSQALANGTATKVFLPADPSNLFGLAQGVKEMFADRPAS